MACLLFAPLGVNAQVEIGIDGGVGWSKVSDFDATTTISIPTGNVRLGFPSDQLSFETLLSFDLVNSDGTLTIFSAYPGVNFPLGDGNYYLRGEAALQFISIESESESELGAGIGLGVKKPVGDTPISFRFEVAYDRWFDAKVNEVRVLVGLSMLVEG
jgi:hypothetical protein